MRIEPGVFAIAGMLVGAGGMVATVEGTAMSSVSLASFDLRVVDTVIVPGSPTLLEVARNETALIDWLAHAAGFEDGESWWNRLVEERGDSEQLFESIAEAMAAVRSEIAKESGAHGEHWRGAHYGRREALREAWMRQCMREAVRTGRLGGLSDKALINLFKVELSGN
mgnify:CR=1 FL=1